MLSHLSLLFSILFSFFPWYPWCRLPRGTTEAASVVLVPGEEDRSGPMDQWPFAKSSSVWKVSLLVAVKASGALAQAYPEANRTQSD